ncbi:MAG: hypothetical protein LQ352_005079 [Teloschistes flavicans]|nr:MAG: hypothetical protein LQ352_005079 [Teloschistes flavicans]
MAGLQTTPPIFQQDSPGVAADLGPTDKIMANLSNTSEDCNIGKQGGNYAEAVAVKASSSDHEKPEAASEAPFPFMKLPLEIRRMIYKDILRQSTDILVQGFLWWWTEDHAIATHCRIFLVSKAFHQEAMPIYFGCNTFSFGCTWVLTCGTKKLNVDYRRQIRSIEITWGSDCCSSAAKFLQSCVSLRRLSIKFDGSLFHWFVVPGQRPVFKAWGVGELLKVRGIRDLDLTISSGDHYSKEYEELFQKLQVLRQPYSAAALRRQDKIDYPPKKAQRSVFGKANVVTRSERKMIADGRKDQEKDD